MTSRRPTIACPIFLVKTGSRRSSKRRSKEASCAMIGTTEPSRLRTRMSFLLFRFITGQQRQYGFS
jgi:hypothetical protein